MQTPITSSPAPSKGLTPGLAAIRVLAWGELFVLLPLHAFWMLYRSTPFVAENTASAVVAAVALLVPILVGLASVFRRVRAALLSAEWLFHWTSAAGMVVLLFYVTLHDPFRRGVPITWPLCFWSITIAFTALADLLLQQRIRAQAPSGATGSWWVGAALAAAAWAALVGLAAGMTWAPYFWSASLVFHALMAPWSRRNPVMQLAPAKRLQGATALVEGLFVASLMLAALLRELFTCSMLGRAEAKYFEFVNLAVHPAFLAGIALALIAARFRFAPLAHAAVAAAFLFTAQTTTWPISLALGYGLTALFVTAGRQGALACALTLPATAAAWAFGLLGFMLAGLVVVSGIGAGFARDLVADMRVAVPALYVVWLVLAGLTFWRSQGKAAAAGPSGFTPRYAPAAAYLAVWIVILIPVGLWVGKTMWPPVVLPHPERIAVGEPSGICHAGGSRSDEEYADLTRLGVHLLRVDFHWGHVQPAPDRWDFKPYDAFLDAAEKHKMKVLALVVYDNNAVETDPGGSKRDHYIAPSDVPKYLEYVRRTVAHYKDRVYAWELWNEPDLTRFWDGPRGEMYELMRRSAEAVREADPKARLLSPAMSGALGAHSAPAIEDLYKVGAMRPVNHPAMHSYLSNPRGYYGEYLRIQNAAAKFGHPGTVWITELGDPDGGTYPWRCSRDELAAYVIKAYTIATRLGVEELAWYCYRDGNPKSLREKANDSEGFFGLENSNGSWKPAAYAYSLFSANCSHSTIRTDLVHLTGGLAARQLRTALYRREDGQSTLILWYEPGLRPGSYARVALDLGQLAEPAVAHSITSDESKPVLDPVIEISETPTVITFTAPDADAPVALHATTSPADAAWLLLAVLAVVGSGLAACRRAAQSRAEI